MTVEEQNKTWACLPKEVRRNFKIAYADYHVDGAYKDDLRDIFGEHNITSDTKPEEMLMVPRSEVLEAYQERACASSAYNKWDENRMQYESEMAMLRSLFGDKCLPDKDTEYSKQRFKVHGKVMFNDNLCRIIGTDYDNKEYQLERISDNHLMGWANESALEHYVEQTSVQVEPKFKVGDRVKEKYHDDSLGTVVEITDDDDKVPLIYVKFDDKYRPIIPWGANELEHYIEPETKDNMEDTINDADIDYDEVMKKKIKDTVKELNLCELLKGCEGEEFYLLDCGNATLDGVQINNARGDSIMFLSFHSTNFDSGTIIINPNGKRKVYGSVILYPSRALYEKYPLDAYSAWMEWKESRIPKRWRAEEGEEYWLIDISGDLCTSQENFSIQDDNYYEFGNYFRTEELAQQAAEAVKETLQKFHEQHK